MALSVITRGFTAVGSAVRVVLRGFFASAVVTPPDPSVHDTVGELDRVQVTTGELDRVQNTAGELDRVQNTTGVH